MRGEFRFCVFGTLLQLQGLKPRVTHASVFDALLDTTTST